MIVVFANYLVVFAFLFSYFVATYGSHDKLERILWNDHKDRERKQSIESYDGDEKKREESFAKF